MGRKIDLEEVFTTLEQSDEDRIEFRVGKFDIRVVHTDEGIVVDIFPYKIESLSDCVLATTYAFDSDIEDAEIENG